LIEQAEQPYRFGSWQIITFVKQKL
jgi:hypothetical protein